MWTLLIVVLSTAIVCRSSGIGSYDYDNKIEETTSSDRDNLTSNVYVLPDQIFNDGKPFFVKTDASGTIDFNAKTTPESLPVPTDAAAEASASSAAAVASVQSTAAAATSAASTDSTRKHDISLDNTVRAQNIHDYLNLPVKYQSSKFVYPLMSSSYANLKYQGNNKNFISNHKFDSSTVKSVPYTTKKYRPTYSTKSYALSKQSTTESYDSGSSSSTKATPIANGTRKYSSIPPRSSTPNRRFSTLNRLSSTTSRPETKFPQRYRSTTTTTTTTTTTSTEKPIDLSDNGLTTASTIASDSDESYIGGGSISISTTISPNRGKNVTENESSDSMNFGDLFSYFFNNAESEETVATRTPTKLSTPSTTVMTLRPISSTTRASIVTKVKEVGENGIKPFSTRYNMTIDSVTRRTPYNRTAASEYRSTTMRPTTTTTMATSVAVGDRVASASTASPQITHYGDKSVVNTGNFRPPASMESIRVSPGAQTASFVTNGHVAANNNNNIGNVHHQYKGQFQPPAQNDMKNIVVMPESNSASFVATSQLQTTTRFDQKIPSHPVASSSKPTSTNLNAIDETTKSGIQFFSKGQVTSAEAYDHPNQSNVVVFNGPSSSNSNNVVIAPGTNTASFVTTSQLSMGLNQHQSPQDQKIKSVENGINAYGLGMQASQRPHGFQLPATTAIPKPSNSAAGSSETQTQQVRFPIENNENAAKPPTTPNGNQPESASLVSVSTNNHNNTIKFPSNQQLSVQSAPAAEGLVKFTDVRNEISDGIDPNNYKQILQAPNSNYVVFRPQSPPIAMVPQAPLVMGLTVPQLYRNPAFVFKKPTIVHYPRKNYTLPNILPQFRPTQPQQVLPPQVQLALSPDAIAANQLRQSQLHRAQYLYNTQNLRYKSPMQILFNQRPMQIRPALEQTQNRRHFELHPGNLNRIYERPMLPHIHNRNVIGANALLIEPQRFEENMKVTVTNGAGAVDMDAGKNPDFENGDQYYNPTPQQQQQQQQQQLLQQQQQLQQQSIVDSQTENEAPKVAVEPVTTLQRLLQQKTGANAIHHGLLSANRNATTVTAAAAAAAAATDINSQTEKPLYVVYPMQKNPIAASNRGNGEIATILAEQMQHKPATIQHHGLPYTLEKHKSRYILNSRPAYEFEKKSDHQPDPIAAENDEEDGGDRPIAIAYSPTEPNPSHLADVYRPTPAHQAQHHHTPIYRNTAADDDSSSSSSSSNNNNNNANQQFQAPFIPSINLENTQSTHNGWSIVTPPSVLAGSKAEAKVNRISASLANTNATSILSISRSDSGETAEEVASVESTTKKFNFDNFKPEFQSGFMPIYKSAVAPPLSSSSSSSSASATSIAPAAPIPPQKSETVKASQSEEKSTDRSDNFNFESLLYDDDDDDDNGDDGNDDVNDE